MKPSFVSGRRLRRDERAVSDVLGSILLVGITVITFAALGLLIFSMKGPTETLHAKLGVGVDPGVGGWGTGDEHIRVTHLGGESLSSTATRINFQVGATAYSYTGSTLASAFTDGKLTVGEIWVNPVGLTIATSDSIQVVVAAPLNVLLTSTAASPGGPTVTGLLRYVTSSTAITGSVAGFSAAQSSGDNGAVATLTEAAAGAVTTTNPNGTTHSNNSALNPQNIFLSNNLVVTLDADGDWVQAAGFSVPANATVVAGVVIGFEGRSQSVTSVVHQQTVSAQGGSGTSIASPSITGAVGNVYVAAVANGASGVKDVTAVSGLGLNWSQVEERQNSASNGRLEVWVGTGTATTGAVTATYAGSVEKRGIVVSRYSGADTGNPVEASTSAEPLGGAATSSFTLSSLPGSTSGVLYVAVNAGNRNGVTFATPAAAGERADVDGGGKIQVAVADGAAAISNVATGTIDGGTVEWQAIGLTLRPAGSPRVELSYLVAGVAGNVALQRDLSSTDTNYTLDVSTDRSWVIADLTNLSVRVQATGLIGGVALIDRAFVTLSTSTGPVTYSLNVEMAFATVPNGTSQVLQLQYRVASPGDNFTVQLWNGTGWRTCAGNLTAVTTTAYSCSLVVPAEWQSGAPRVRFLDATPAGSVRGILSLGYVRLATQ